jgi:hypothetical protein
MLLDRTLKSDQKPCWTEHERVTNHAAGQNNVLFSSVLGHFLMFCSAVCLVTTLYSTSIRALLLIISFTENARI